MDASVSQKTGRLGETFITTFTFEGFKPTVDMGMSQRCPRCGKLTTHFTCEFITSVYAWTSHDMSTLWKPFVACFIFEEFITGVDVSLICKMCRLWKQLWAQRLLVQVNLYCIFYTWEFSTIMDSNVCHKTCVSAETFTTHFTVDRFLSGVKCQWMFHYHCHSHWLDHSSNSRQVLLNSHHQNHDLLVSWTSIPHYNRQMTLDYCHVCVMVHLLVQCQQITRGQENKVRFGDYAMGWAKKLWLNSWQIFLSPWKHLDWLSGPHSLSLRGYHGLCPSDYSDEGMLLTNQLHLIYGIA